MDKYINHLIRDEFLFNILEGKDLVFHAYLFPGSETMNKPPGQKRDFLHHSSSAVL